MIKVLPLLSEEQQSHFLIAFQTKRQSNKTEWIQASCLDCWHSWERKTLHRYSPLKYPSHPPQKKQNRPSYFLHNSLKERKTIAKKHLDLHFCFCFKLEIFIEKKMFLQAREIRNPRRTGLRSWRGWAGRTRWAGWLAGSWQCMSTRWWTSCIHPSWSRTL